MGRRTPIVPGGAKRAAERLTACTATTLAGRCRMAPWWLPEALVGHAETHSLASRSNNAAGGHGRTRPIAVLGRFSCGGKVAHEAHPYDLGMVLCALS